MKRGFSLIEVLIVVAILGILAAIAIPQFQSHTQQAKEAAAKDNLRILRQHIEFYATQHGGVPPGYLNGDTSASPSSAVFIWQLTKSTNESGELAEVGTAGYPLGPYLSAMPKNPFNNEIMLAIVGNSESFPAEATEVGGWIYKAAAKEIRLNWPGTDSKGVRYYDY